MKSIRNHHFGTTLPPSSRRINLWGAMNLQVWMLYGLIIFMALPICCRSTSDAVSSSNNSVYRESESTSQPSECHRSLRPVYFLENTQDAYRLVVTIPEKVSRKHLKIDVDYDDGHVDVFGWWFEGKVRGEAARKMCVHGQWGLDPELLSEEAIVSSDLVSVYDLSMAIQENQLILSVPMAIEQPCSPTPPEPTPIETNDEAESQLANHHASIVIAYGTSLWKKLRGLVRLKDDHAQRNFHHSYLELASTTTNNSTTTKTPPALSSLLWDLHFGRPPSSLAYEKYRQDALEDFLAYTLGIIDQTSD